VITIITDSSACFKKSEAKDLGIRIIPMNYTVNGHGYSESFSDQNGDFESLLQAKGVCTTAAPNTAAYLSAFEEELQKGNQILCITISSRLSGAYSTAYMAARQTGKEDIAVFDSHSTAGGLYLLVKEAKRLIDEGGGLEQIMSELPAIRDRVVIAFSVDDMTPLRNSGRIGFVRMSVSTILNIRPILVCKEGVVVSDSITRGSAELIKRMVQKITPGVKSVVLSYVGESRLATNLYNVIAGAHSGINLQLHKIGPVLGIHLGLSVVGVSFILP